MSTQQHLLMIEDDQRLADMVVTYLGNNGLSVAHCPDATSGLQQLQRQPLPDLLILDLMLPDLDGLEVCRRRGAGADADRQGRSDGPRGRSGNGRRRLPAQTL